MPQFILPGGTPDGFVHLDTPSAAVPNPTVGFRLRIAEMSRETSAVFTISWIRANNTTWSAVIAVNAGSGGSVSTMNVLTGNLGWGTIQLVEENGFYYFELVSSASFSIEFSTFFSVTVQFATANIITPLTLMAPVEATTGVVTLAVSDRWADPAQEIRYPLIMADGLLGYAYISPTSHVRIAHIVFTRPAYLPAATYRYRLTFSVVWRSLSAPPGSTPIWCRVVGSGMPSTKSMPMAPNGTNMRDQNGWGNVETRTSNMYSMEMESSFSSWDIGLEMRTLNGSGVYVSSVGDTNAGQNNTYSWWKMEILGKV